LSFNK